MFFAERRQKQVTEFREYLESHSPWWVQDTWVPYETRFYQKYLSLGYNGISFTTVGGILMLLYLTLFMSPAGKEGLIDGIFIVTSLPLTMAGLLMMGQGFSSIESAPDLIRRMDFQTT
jgi:hypothetical protein